MVLHKTKTFLCSGIFILIFSGFSALGAQELSENSFDSQWDWHVGATYSPLYTGMYKNVWDTVEYLAILQREGNKKEQGLSPLDSFSTGALGGFGWVFYNENSIRMSFGGEYALTYFQTKGTYTFGENGSFFFAPETGAQQKLTLQGLDHKLSPYLKISFLGSSFPIDLQLNVGVSLVHLLSMELKDHDGKTYKTNVLKPNQPIKLNGTTIPFPAPQPTSYDLNFGLKNTMHLALTTGFRASFHALFVGFNYTTNVLQHSYDVQVGLSFKNNFFKDAWK